MPNTPLNRYSHDVAVKSVPPANPTQRRVPTAEAMTLQAEIAAELTTKSRREMGWLKRPTMGVTSPRTITLSDGVALMPLAPNFEVPISSASATIPAIPTTSEIVSRNEILNLVGVWCEVGAEQDAELGQITFDALDPATEAITQQVGENTRRYRFFWLLVLSPSTLTPSAFYDALPLLTADTDYPVPIDGQSLKRIQIVNATATGFTVGSFQVYAMDPNWAAARYLVMQDKIAILPLATIQRRQNITVSGYTWGNNGEEPLSLDFSVFPAGMNIAVPGSNPVLEQLRRIVSGQVRPYGKAVQNFSAGPVSGNIGRVGEAAASPNNSVCLGSRNRVSYTNEGIIETLAVQRITAGNDGNGNALVTAIAENLPSGYRFSEVAGNHKIYLANGDEISRFGQWGSLGAQGGLSWIADANQLLLPGQVAYVVPAIVIPSGSGFNVPFIGIDAAWDGIGSPVSTENIRNGATNDLDAYTAPANSESYIIIYGTERAAIHRIYKHIQITTDANGIAIIPSDDFGCFAFISGVSGRLDKPVVTGLTPNSTLNALIYYPPRIAETWQFQLKTVPYAGFNRDVDWLNGATIISEPVVFAHTQGGGGKVFRGDADIQFSPISMHLPAVNSAIKAYDLAMPIQVASQSYPGQIRTQWQFELSSASGCVQPLPGRILVAENATSSQPRSLRAHLKINGFSVGFRAPRLENNWAYQVVVAFAVEKNKERRLVVATRNTTGGDFALNSDTGTAIGVYSLN
jgi:hypothetical protein